MRKLSIDLEHCYGIKKLKTDFDFDKHNAFAIYAPNGAMKSSLAKTFSDASNDKQATDKIFPTRLSKSQIVDESGAALPPESILVVQPYDEVLGHSEKTSTLLVNAVLRKEYEQLHAEIDQSKDSFIKLMQTQSGSKKNIEKEISSAFTPSDSQFYKALIRIYDEVLTQKESPFANVKYDLLFDDKVQELLGTKDFKTAIESYIKKYNELIAASTYFKKGVFNYYNASTIAKNLADNGFFRAKHTIRLNASEAIEIADEKELEKLIAKEKESISNDADLRKKFADIEKLLIKNVSLRQFDSYLCDNEAILPHLSNMAEFKDVVWKSFIVSNIEAYKDLVDKYRGAEKRRLEIEEEAGKERTQWEDVIEIFNSRFFVPFKLEAKNRTSVILGQEPLLTLGFTFEDSDGSTSVERSDLIAVLSTGERKALYILNIIFEIEARTTASQETLLIVDDIADSFDYKNKYAIIQYLRDIADAGNFKQIILTHNFDFFRTLSSRLVGYSGSLMVSKTSTGITLSQASGIKNVFVNDWKINFGGDAKKRIASIPFMRNLIEFTKGEDHADFLKMTSLLHWKADTATILETELFEIYNRLFTPVMPVVAGARTVVDLIHQEAETCLAAAEGMNFENKIVLSIAARLKAEEFMVIRINDATVTGAIKANQTAMLLKEFKARFKGEKKSIDVIDRVALMTPENIHLNSFMYEPILDMSDQHLRSLYGHVKALI